MVKKHPIIKISNPIVMSEEGLQALLNEIKTIETGEIGGIRYHLYETGGKDWLGRGVMIGESSNPRDPVGKSNASLVNFAKIKTNYVLTWIYRLEEDEDLRTSRYGPSDFAKIRDELGKKIHSMAQKYGPRLDKQWTLEYKLQ
jgi:hypothetical protein